MKYLTIPGTNLRVSALGLGTASLGTTIDRAASFTLLDAWLDQGGTLLDTASAYANWIPGEKSLSEKTIGAWLAQRPVREHVIIATKGANPDVSAPGIPRLAPDEIRADLQASLRNLRVETIDLYYLHRDDPQRPVGEIMEELNRYVRAGQVRALGCSNWRLARIRAAQEYASQHSLQGFAVDQMLWNAAVCDYEAIGDPTIVQMDGDLWQYHCDTGLAAAAFSAQANGYFTKLAAGLADQIRTGTRRMYHSAANIERLARMRELAEATGYTITQIVLGYLLGQPFATIALVGCQNLAQLQDSASAGDIRLTPAQIAFIDAA